LQAATSPSKDHSLQKSFHLSYADKNELKKSHHLLKIKNTQTHDQTESKTDLRKRSTMPYLAFGVMRGEVL